MSTAEFFDTNILFYAFSSAGIRTSIAEELLAQGGVVSVQVLNELASSLHRKLKMRWAEVQDLIGDVLVLCPSPQPLSLDTHRSALQICTRYGFAIYDALILASALQAGCTTLYSEDMQQGQLVDGVRIINPFH